LYRLFLTSGEAEIDIDEIDRATNRLVVGAIKARKLRTVSGEIEEMLGSIILRTSRVFPKAGRRSPNGVPMAKTRRKEKVEAFDAQYVCTFRPEPEGGYTVRCPAFPEIVSFGASLEEARRNAREAIELCLEVYRDSGWPIQHAGRVLRGGVLA
jgi:antitoxin HicB